jgi:DNA-binding IclR family transcriptional regulator
VTAFTVLVDGRAEHGLVATRAGRVLLSPGPAWTALGAAGDAEADLVDLAQRLDRPLAVDLDESVAFLGTSARARAERLRSLEAPDFTLPDLDGRPHTLAGHRGKKVFLVAYASW